MGKEGVGEKRVVHPLPEGCVRAQQMVADGGPAVVPQWSPVQ